MLRLARSVYKQFEGHLKLAAQTVADMAESAGVTQVQQLAGVVARLQKYARDDATQSGATPDFGGRTGAVATGGGSARAETPSTNTSAAPTPVEGMTSSTAATRPTAAMSSERRETSSQAQPASEKQQGKATSSKGKTPTTKAAGSKTSSRNRRRTTRRRAVTGGQQVPEGIIALQPEDAIDGSTYLARIIWALGVSQLEGGGSLRPADMARMIMSRSAVSLEPPNVARYIRRSNPSCLVIDRTEGSSSFYKLSTSGKKIFDERFRTQ